MSYVSFDYRFIYVRVPRTGSTTFCHYLRGTFGPTLVDASHQHATARQLRDALPEQWGEYRTFGFIRNPWHWLVSLYSSGVSAQAGDVIDHWQGNATPDPLVRTNMDWEGFVRQRVSTPVDWLVDENGEIMVDDVFIAEHFFEKWKLRANETKKKWGVWWDDDELVEYVRHKFHREIEIGNYEGP